MNLDLNHSKLTYTLNDVYYRCTSYPTQSADVVTYGESKQNQISSLVKSNLF